MISKNSTGTIVEKLANCNESLIRNLNNISQRMLSQISSEKVRIFEYSVISDTLSNASLNKIKKDSEIIRQTINEQCQSNNINLPFTVSIFTDLVEGTKKNDNGTVFAAVLNNRFRYAVNIIFSKEFDNVDEIMTHIALKHGVVFNELNLWSEEVQNMLMIRYKISDAYNSYNFDLNDGWC